MNAQNDASLGMLKLVVACLRKYAADITTSGFTILNTYADDLDTKIDNIRTTSEQTNVNTKPITEQKADARAASTDLAVRVTGAVFGYSTDVYKKLVDMEKAAIAAGQPIPDGLAEEKTKWLLLSKEVEKMNAPFFKSKKDEEVADFLYNAWNIGDDVETTPSVLVPELTLAQYGIKKTTTTTTGGTTVTVPGTLALLDNSITAYTHISTAPKEAINTRKGFNSQLDTQYIEAYADVAKIGKVMYGLKNDYPEFYKDFVAAENSDKTKTMKTQIIGTVTQEKMDGGLKTIVPVEGAIVIISAPSYTRKKDGQTIKVDTEPIEVETDEDGEYSVPTPDIYARYVVDCGGVTGYAEQQVENIKVKKGKKKRQDFLLKAIPAQPGS